jgi:hypothetical protein
MTRRLAAVLLVAAACAQAAGGSNARPAHTGGVGSPAILIGANYTHFADGGCRNGGNSLLHTGIIQNYGRPGVAALVRRQLTTMRARGLRSLRLIVWHQTDASGLNWGVISSYGGRPAPADAKSLIGYFKAVRAAGFAQLTVSFGPTVVNDPRSPSYDPGRLEENWQFIRYVRALARRYGPRSTHIDLLNEGTPAPSDKAAVLRVRTYLAELYGRYVQAYGSADVSVSTISTQSPADAQARLQNLIDALVASGEPLPRWFDVHVAYDSTAAAQELSAVEQTLERDGLDQPLVLGEVAYDDAPTASAISDYVAEFHRPVLEVMEWPLTADRPCRGVSVSPPYTANAYIDALKARPHSVATRPRTSPEP